MKKTKITRFEGGVEWHVQSDGKHWLQVMRLEKVFFKGEVANKDEIAWAYLNEKEDHIIGICQSLECNAPFQPGTLYGAGVSCLLKEKEA